MSICISLNTGPAWVRTAHPYQQRAFLAGPPPYPVRWADELIDRDAANVPDWYAPWAHYFLRTHDEFIAHATQLKSCTNKPRSWHIHKPGEVWGSLCGDYTVFTVASDHGWVIERSHLLEPTREQVLTFTFMEAPILCPGPAGAARLAEACIPDPPSDGYLLGWRDILR
jgi:hypothetical protein